MELSRVLLEIPALLALAALVGVATRRIHVPTSVALVVIGIVAAGVGLRPDVARLQGEVFEEVVILLFLPLLVFSAALGIDLRAFTRNLGAILALAIPAFLISVVLVGLTLHVALGTALLVAFLFGALISATDPVAVVAVFREVGVPRRLLTLVEGESLLNDGVAIVLFAILVEAATGGGIDVVGGVLEFSLVFAGGALIGVVAGLVAALALPWMDRLAAAALSLAVAYGSFVVAEVLLGFSGVMAAAAAGMVLAGLAPSRASADVRETWEQLWESLDYVANALLFLLVGLVIGPRLLLDQLGPILLAAAVVLIARALAVIPIVWVLERVAHMPRVGRRNEAVLIWGGLRGAVALALALALPEDLAEREFLVTLTGGVVLATLLLNATTIRWLVSGLGLDEPSATDRYVAAVAQVFARRAASRAMDDLDLVPDDDTVAELDATEHAALDELARLPVDEDEEYRIIVGRGLHVERETYQSLSDAGLLPPAVTRTLLHEVDDEIEELAVRGHGYRPGGTRRKPPRTLEQLSRRVIAWLPEPAGTDPTEMASAEATARLLAVRRASEAFNALAELPGMSSDTVEHVRRTFHEWHQDALERLDELDSRADPQQKALRARQAKTLATAAALREITALVESGLLPATVLADVSPSSPDESVGVVPPSA